MSEVRVRFAPSPTGYLHVGGARTALFDFLYAKNKKGKFILRIEDTDLERSTEEALRMQIQDLQWLGLNWDEGVDPVSLKDIGPYGPYRQSDRLPIYREYAQKLLQKGVAYYCFLTDSEIEQQREEAKKQGRPPQVESPYRDWSLEQAQAKIDEGAEAVIRFKVPKQKTQYTFQDLIRGEVSFPSDMVGDFVLMRSNGMPVYNFCCAIDDALMKITHVFRAEEHLSNTLRQMMIYEALGFALPEFGHVSIILGGDRQKLSKRHGATSCNEYRQRGYLPEAINNYLALLGWSHPEGKEVMSEQEMIQAFSVERINAAPAVFDETKLTWMNSVYLRELPWQQLWKKLEAIFAAEKFEFPQDENWQKNSIEVFKTSMHTLNDAIELYRPLSQQGFAIGDAGKETMSWESSRLVVGKWKELIQAQDKQYLSEEDFSAIQNQVKDECDVKGKFLFMPIRVAVIGVPQGAELKMLVPLIHKSELLKRADQAMAAV